MVFELLYNKSTPGCLSKPGVFREGKVKVLPYTIATRSSRSIRSTSRGVLRHNILTQVEISSQRTQPNIADRFSGYNISQDIFGSANQNQFRTYVVHEHLRSIPADLQDSIYKIFVNPLLAVWKMFELLR